MVENHGGWQMLIGGSLVAAKSRETYSVLNPSTGAILAQVPAAGTEDVDACVQAALRASFAWRRLTPPQRAAYLLRLAEALRHDSEEYARLDALNCGNPIRASRQDVERAATALEYLATFASALNGVTVPASPDHLHYTVREPYGVVVRIIPYNHPILFASTRIAAPLLAGNAVILKPSHQAPLSALRLAHALREIFPPGVVNVITGGPTTGNLLVQHPEVKRVSFTGSLRTGLAVMAACASSGRVKHVSLELGGRNALVLFPDVDIDVATEAILDGLNLTRCQAQSCGSTSRVFVHRALYSQVVERVADKIERLQIGDPLQETTDMGPLISLEHLEQVLSYVELGRRENARLVTGGYRLKGALANGFFMRPAVFDEVDPMSVLAQDEIFGPVVTFTPWDDYDAMVGMVNKSRYGLTASIWTNDLKLAHETAARLGVGYVWINTVERRWPGVPFGGFKDSGVGREYDIEEILSYTQVKAVNVALRDVRGHDRGDAGR